MRIKWILFSNFSYVAIQWLVLSLFSKVYTSNEVGEYFFALAVATPIMTFFSLKLTGFIIASKDDLYSKDEYRFIRLFYSILSGIFVVLISVIFFHEQLNLYVMMFVVVFKITEQYDDVEASFQSKQLNFKGFSLVKIRRGIAYIITIGFFVITLDDFHSVFLCATLFYFMYWFLFNYGKIKNITKVNKENLIDIFKKMYPMGMSGGIQSLGTSGCRVYVGLLLGKSLLAVFGSISYSITAINIVTNALGNYYLPYFSKCKNDKNNFYRELFKSQITILLLTLILVVMIYVFGENLLLIAFNNTVSEYNIGLIILSFSAAIKASTNLLGTAILSTEKYTYQVFLTIVNLLTLIFFIYYFSSYGIYGVFYATLSSSFIEWFFMVIISIRYFNAFF